MEDQLALKAKNVAGNIRKLREFRDYTQDYLASQLKISQNAYSKLELGYCKISLERLYAIANVLNVEPVYILTMEHTELIKIDLPNQS
ncbi:helix-turn-helix domain-containing protein [Pedobacter namyangjuensis]|uniref:helix-turn-helix domain-containing protein n=1 Tax=Pedobacter namyangjuensis TaxID=600626 RepID=UPI000DE4FD13|nr:helix-turn-helix transcriptional regulator [Pedobacter namyangjuensis]